MKIPKFKIEYNNYIDLFSWLSRKGVIVVNQPISSVISSVVSSTLLVIQAQEYSRIISIYLFNSTSDIISAMCLVDLIESVKRNGFIVETIGFGEMDLGTILILNAGNKGKRHVTKNSRINFYLGKNLKFKSIDRSNKNSILRETEKIISAIKNIFQEKCEISDEKVNELLRTSRFFSNEEVLEFKIADSII